MTSSVETDWVSRFADEVIAEADRRAPGRPIVCASGLSPSGPIHLGNLRITNRDTPGHAEDGVIYVVGNWPEDAPHVAIIGDTIFAGSLATGFISTEMLRENVREKILSLPEETLLCPGHGPLTTVAEERAHNPFFCGCI